MFVSLQDAVFPDPINSVRLLIQLTATRQGDMQGDSQATARQDDTDSQTSSQLLSALAKWGSKYAINSEDKVYFDDCLVSASLSGHC